jgi:hypothetical protein
MVAIGASDVGTVQPLVKEGAAVTKARRGEAATELAPALKNRGPLA